MHGVTMKQKLHLPTCFFMTVLSVYHWNNEGCDELRTNFGRSPLFMHAVPCLPYEYPMTYIFHISNDNVLKRWEIYPLSEQGEYLCGEGRNYSAERTVMRPHHSVHQTWNTTHFHRLDNHWPWLGCKKPNFFRKPYYKASINKTGLVLFGKTQLHFVL